MPTFVEICQMARQECGMGGSGPTSVTGQTGALATLVQRTAQAWIDIQKSRPYWKFLRRKFGPFALTVGQNEYVVADASPAGYELTTMDKWDKQSCWVYQDSTSDENSLIYVPYHDFRRNFRTYPAGRPRHFTEGPGGTIIYDRTPDVVYYVTKDYWTTPERLVASEDVPALPEQFHDIIAWKSVMKFAGNEMAVDLYRYAKSEYDPMFLQLCIDQMDMPDRVRSYALASGRRSSETPFGDAR